MKKKKILLSYLESNNYGDIYARDGHESCLEVIIVDNTGDILFQEKFSIKEINEILEYVKDSKNIQDESKDRIVKVLAFTEIAYD